MSKDKTTSIKVDQDLWLEFKGACAMQNKTMTDVLNRLIADYLAEYYREE
jgi:hypothetical protein